MRASGEAEVASQPARGARERALGGGRMPAHDGLLDVSTEELSTAPCRGTVVLLHGIGQQPWCMGRLRRTFTRRGWHVLNIGYRSRRAPIAVLADEVAEMLRDPEATGAARLADRPMHVVGFSMGGLVARAAIAKIRPDNLGRMVLIGTPAHGSEVADLLQNNRLYRLWFGPAGGELTTAAAQLLADSLYPGAPPCDIGVIAGRTALDPVSWWALPRPNDGKVSVASTRIVGMRDHVVVGRSHVSLLYSRRVAALTVRFLEQGRFGV